jgi:hypothetical protein
MIGPEESVLRLSGIHVNRLVPNRIPCPRGYSIETYHIIYAE